MDWLHALIMGIVQGLTEYLPVSSSGHLEIFHNLLGVDTSGAESLEFDVMLHVATVLSTIVVLWKEFVPLCKSFFTFKRDDNFFYVCKILVSCIPIVVVGVFFKDTLETFFGNGLLTVGICLCITALLLWFAYYFGNDSGGKNKPAVASAKRCRHEISYLDAFVIGCAQAVAVLPGLSRSGATIATGILLGDKKEKVATFSFFMVIIPILGEALLDLAKAAAGSEGSVQGSIGILPLLIGFVASFVVGCLACKWMIELVKKGKLVWFAAYCLLMGIVCIICN